MEKAEGQEMNMENTGCPKKIVPFSKIQSVQLIPLSTHWAPRKKNKKRVPSFSDILYIRGLDDIRKLFEI